MSLIVTVYVREGIVMASDSRLTLNVTQVPQVNVQPSTPAPQLPDSGATPQQASSGVLVHPQSVSMQIVQFAATQSDSTYKTFVAPGNIGISTAGAADIQGMPITGYIDSFIAENLVSQDPPLDVDAVPQKLLEYFRGLPIVPASVFHVAGYKLIDSVGRQHVWNVGVAQNTVTRLNPTDECGFSWSGEGDIMYRLVQPVGLLDGQGNLSQVLPHFSIPFNYFTLQDAIDFAMYAIKATIDSMRFQPRPKTVGGPIDVLVIKPDSATWIQRKELRVGI